jgi:transcriptional regulator with XRE-family HTH domain
LSREKLKNSAIATLLAEIRMARGKSFTEFAVELGVSEAAVRHYEAGRREPDALLLRRLADIAPTELRNQIEELLPPSLRAEFRIRTSGRRITEATVLAMHEAVDIIIDKGSSGFIDAVARYLGERAVRTHASAESRPEKKK